MVESEIVDMGSVVSSADEAGAYEAIISRHIVNAMLSFFMVRADDWGVIELVPAL